MVIENKDRPYWYVDAKWVCGILLAVVLGMLLVVVGLSRLTERKTAIDLAVLVLAGQFSRDGLDSPIYTPDVQKQLAATGTDSLKLLPDSNIVVTRKELETEKPRDLRLKVLRQMVAPMYDQGPEGLAASLSSDPAKQQNIANQAGAFKLISAETHRKLGTVLLGLAVIGLVLAGGMVYFSAGWGRLAVPGVVMLWVAAPMVIILTVLGSAGGGIGPVSADIVKQIAGVFRPGYVWTGEIGFGLLVLAGVLKLALRKPTAK